MVERLPADERLPWVEVKRRAPIAVAPRSFPWWIVGLLALALAVVAALLFVRETGGSKQPPPVPPTVPALRPAAPVPQPAAASSDSPIAPERAPALARAEQEEAAAPHPMPEQLLAAGQIARAQQVRLHREEAQRMASAVSRPAYSPRVAQAGQAVQLGAYGTAEDAEAKAQLFRYRYRGLLAALPKAVLPFRPKGSPRFFYRVQFIAPNQAHAEVVCQRLRAAGKSCIVVY